MSTHQRLWPFHTIRVFAILNLLFGLEGLAALIDSVSTRLTHDRWPQEPLYLAQAYYIRSGISLFFVALTVVAGVYLWRLHGRAWTMCKVLFIGQILYFFDWWYELPLYLAMPERTSQISRAFGATAGTGDMGINLQTLTGYPVIALIGLKIAFSKLPRAPASTAETIPADSPSG
jgi:hypothetical protein